MQPRNDNRTLLMTDQRTPIDIFRNWYQEQPKEIQDSIAVFVLVKAPRFTTGELDIIMRPIDTFRKYLDEICDTTGAIVGEILLIRAIIDFSVIRQFASHDDWAMKKDRNEDIADEIEIEHGPNPMSDDLRKMLAQFPERQQLWLDATKSWKILRNTELSDEFLEAWQDDHRARSEER